MTGSSHRQLAAPYVVDTAEAVVAAFESADIDLAAAVAELKRALEQYELATKRDDDTL